MERALILKRLIQDKGYNLKEFAAHAEIPYTTLVNILNRGVSKAGFLNVVKICEALGITVEQLEQMAGSDNITDNKENPDLDTIAAHRDGQEWTDEEIQAIEDFKQYVLSKRDKK